MEEKLCRPESWEGESCGVGESWRVGDSWGVGKT